MRQRLKTTQRTKLNRPAYNLEAECASTTTVVSKVKEPELFWISKKLEPTTCKIRAPQKCSTAFAVCFFVRFPPLLLSGMQMDTR